MENLYSPQHKHHEEGIQNERGVSLRLKSLRINQKREQYDEQSPIEMGNSGLEVLLP